MTRKEMSQESALHKKRDQIDENRMLAYKAFAAAFIYPKEKEMQRKYDELFRAKEIWLYGAEYTLKTEFQRANYLSDIMGFYRAFGLDTDKDRPDLLSNELEFMYYIIFKKCHALRNKGIKDAKEKASICADAQKKFFTEHLYPAAKKIAERIIANPEKNFYSKKANEMLKFLESEKKYFKREV